MQSTFSRTRHSSRISEPDMSLDSGTPLDRCTGLVDIIPPNKLCSRQKIFPKNQKATGWFLFPTRWLFGNRCPKPSSGGRYNDLNNNGPKLRNLTQGKHSGDCAW